MTTNKNALMYAIGNSFTIPEFDPKKEKESEKSGRIYHATNIFSSISDTFDTYPFHFNSQKTGGTTLKVYGFEGELNYSQLFNMFSRSFNGMCLNQAQIVKTATHYGALFSPNAQTFFLLMGGEYFFVANVYAYKENNRGIDVTPIGRSNKWIGSAGHRIIIPQ